VGATNEPFIHDFGESFVLGVLPCATSAAKPESEALICAVGQNWLVTVHEGEVASLAEFADHLRGDSALGRLDAPSFLARLLEWVVNGYLDHLDDLHATIDDLEESILRDRADNEVVGRLIELRHEIGRLRRRIAPHRQVFATLAHPSFDVISDSSSAREFGILADRLETAVQAVDSTREMVVGAFDVFMTQTAQRTNNVMRVLTIVSLTLLPATLIAGILGENMLPKYLMHSWVTWAGIGLMVVIAAVVIVTMRLLRRWL
jgi:magnesium transporter